MATERLQNFLQRLEGVKRSGETGRQFTACCPAHEDSEQSLGIGLADDGRILLHCFAGCETKDIVRSLNIPWQELFPDEESPEQHRNGVLLTLKQLAFFKRVPEDFLRSQCGLYDMPGQGVAIPYPDAEQKPAEVKRRTDIIARKGSYWPTGRPLMAYGLWKLKKARDGKVLILVEGESDCWTLWFHEFPGLGIPGASATKTLTADVIVGFETIYVWQEPGDAGESFVQGIANQLGKLGYKGKAGVIRSEAIKDPNDLHKRNPDKFKEIFQGILAAAQPMPKPGKERKGKKALPVHISGEAKEAAQSGAGAPPPASGYFALTDIGNAKRLVFRHGNEIRYCHPWRKWMVWDGARWKTDDTASVIRKAADAVRAIYAEAERAESKEDREQIARHAVKSESAYAIRCMVEMAQSEGPVPVLPGDMDNDPWAFNCLNGTVDLRTGELRPHRREDMHSKIARVEYDPLATCPTWENFLDRIMDGREEMVRFLQLAAGYSLTGVVSEKCFFFLHGSGDNGKSTFIEALADLMGDYWCKTTAETVLSRGDRSSGGVPNDVARLQSVRMVATSELPQGREMDESRVKDLTGRDTISARFMRAEWFDFKPEFKLWMAGNHKPIIKGSDEGIWKRVRLIPFDVSIPKSQQDESLPEKLRNELSGILNWAIAGCLAWQEGKLPIPKEVHDASEDYRDDMDFLAEFIADRCILGAEYRDSRGRLYDEYLSWCNLKRQKPRSRLAFGDSLRSKGMKDHKIKGTRYWVGIKLPSSNNDSDELEDPGQTWGAGGHVF